MIRDKMIRCDYERPITRLWQVWRGVQTKRGLAPTEPDLQVITGTLHSYTLSHISVNFSFCFKCGRSFTTRKTDYFLHFFVLLHIWYLQHPHLGGFLWLLVTSLVLNLGLQHWYATLLWVSNLGLCPQVIQICQVCHYIWLFGLHDIQTR